MEKVPDHSWLTEEQFALAMRKAFGMDEAEARAWYRRATTACVLCGEAPALIGMFFPTSDYRKTMGVMHALAGNPLAGQKKHSIFLYALCAECGRDTAKASEAVEAACLGIKNN